MSLLSNPIFWIGAAVAAVAMLLAFVAFIALIGRANDDVELTDRRQSTTGHYPANSAGAAGPARTRRSELPGGPR